MSFPQNWKIRTSKRDVDMPDWRLYPKAVPTRYYGDLMREVIPMCRERSASRKSCVFGDFYYAGVECYTWKECPQVLLDLIGEVQEITGDHYDYCLVHLYEDGNSYIGWHNDKEASYHQVASLSLGTPRKFRLRKLKGRDRDWSGSGSGSGYEYVLQSGDLFVMKDACQRNWEHTVPKEQTIKTPRINVTFRMHESTEG